MPSEPGQDEHIVADHIVPRPRPLRWVGYFFVALLLAMFVYSVLSNRNWDWGTVSQYLFASTVLHGLLVTILLTVCSMLVALVIGAVVAGFRMSSSRVLSGLARVYIWFFRGVPVVVLVVFFVYLAQLYPSLSLGIPFGGPKLLSENTNSLVAPIVGCILGLSLNESAFTAEIIRSAVASVPKGQIEAACALGMTPAQLRRRVMAPQMLPVALPPYFNDVINMTKITAIVVLASVTDLFSAVTQIAQQDFAETPLLIVAAIWYLALAAVLTLLQMGLERLFNRHLRPRGA